MRRLLTFLLAWGIVQGAHAEVRDPHGVAVIVGNRNYAHALVGNVKYAHRDADAFRRYVLDVLGYRPENVIDLRDASQAQMESAFGNERSHAGLLWRYLDGRGRSDVVVFYSGHGVPGLKDRRPYLLPVDGDPNTAEINGYPVDLLYGNLAKLEDARSARVYLDACFSGFGGGGGMLIRSASPVQAVAALPEGWEKLTVLTASSGLQVASWDEEARHGLFTHHVLDALYGRGDADGKVTAREVKDYLDEHMTPSARRRLGRIQDAGLSGAVEAVLSSAPTGGFPKRPVVGADDAAFERAKALDTVESYAAYLSRWERHRQEASSLKAARQEAARRARAEAGRREAASLDRGGRVLVQRGLASLGFDPGPADGAFGPKTEGAVRSWQVAKGYAGTGRLTRDQASALVASGKAVKVAVGVYPGTGSSGRAGFRRGEVFRDCGECPEMVVVPAGSFTMGSPPSEEGRQDNEGPQHRVRISEPFAVGRYEVTRGEYGRFVSATGHSSGDSCRTLDGNKWKSRSGYRWRNPGYSQTDRDPVACMSWNDAKRYAEWLSRKTGKGYRLLSESEWEYAARAGTTGPFHTGGTISTDQANYYGRVVYGSGRKGVWWKKTLPVGSFAPNGFGLHDMHGNVWEWVEDCWNGSYAGAPADGSAWKSGNCGRRVLRGGSWFSLPWNLRSAFRHWFEAGIRNLDLGFRVARTLAP